MTQYAKRALVCALLCACEETQKPVPRDPNLRGEDVFTIHATCRQRAADWILECVSRGSSVNKLNDSDNDVVDDCRSSAMDLFWQRCEVPR